MYKLSKYFKIQNYNCICCTACICMYKLSKYFKIQNYNCICCTACICMYKLSKYLKIQNYNCICCTACICMYKLSKDTKIRIYKTVILPLVLYGCETWSPTLREEHRLRVDKTPTHALFNQHSISLVC